MAACKENLPAVLLAALTEIPSIVLARMHIQIEKIISYFEIIRGCFLLSKCKVTRSQSDDLNVFVPAKLE